MRKKEPLEEIQEVFLHYAFADPNLLPEISKMVSDALLADPKAPGSVNLRDISGWLSKHPEDKVWTELKDDQMEFVRILGELATGSPFKGIEGFTKLIRAGRAHPKLIPHVDLETEEVEIRTFLRFDPPEFWDKILTPGKKPSREAFRLTLQHITAYSLVDYLSKARDARERLRRCEQCGRFFVSKTSKRLFTKADGRVYKAERFCNISCRNAFHRPEPFRKTKGKRIS